MAYTLAVVSFHQMPCAKTAGAPHANGKCYRKGKFLSESSKISINKRESELLSEAGSEYVHLLRFESARGHGVPSCASESERRPGVMDLQVEQAKREAQHRL